jgi:hypothetical protein
VTNAAKQATVYHLNGKARQVERSESQKTCLISGFSAMGIAGIFNFLIIENIQVIDRDSPDRFFDSGFLFLKKEDLCICIGELIMI